MLNNPGHHQELAYALFYQKIRYNHITQSDIGILPEGTRCGPKSKARLCHCVVSVRLSANACLCKQRTAFFQEKSAGVPQSGPAVHYLCPQSPGTAVESRGCSRKPHAPKYQRLYEGRGLMRDFQNLWS